MSVKGKAGAKNTAPLFEDAGLHGQEFAEAHSAAASEWFANLFNESASDHKGLALVAVGGFGRGELWPHSDLDVILLHKRRSDIGEVAERLWYPVWDRNLKLGYGVFTPKEAVELASLELDVATSFLDARLIAGDADLVTDLQKRIDKLWDKQGERFLDELAESVEARHRRIGDVAFKIEPDLKEARGGLRDLHALRWAERARPGFASDFLDGLEPQREILSEARVALHRLRGRAGDVLVLDDQDAVAEGCGYANAGELMLRLALAGRRVAWHSDEAWDRYQRSRNESTENQPWVLLTQELELVDDYIEIRPEVDSGSDPLLLLRMAEQAAHSGKTMGRRSLLDLHAESERIPEPWPDEARELFASIFLAGAGAIDVVEDLDQFDLMVRILPEWQAVRCKPQRNVLHTFTVDRHLCEAAVNASVLADRVSRPDLLVVGALLHDIGKGFPGDHTRVGMEKIAKIGRRMGYPTSDLAVLIDLCRYHLLLPEVATRRDVTDPGTIRSVAATVDSVEFLHLLAALTESDSKATGPAVWGSWQEGLLRQLVGRTEHMLEHNEMVEVESEFPNQEILDLIEVGEQRVIGQRLTLTVIAPDVAGLFSKIAGVLTMLGLDVLDADAVAHVNGMAASQFTLQESATGPIDWDDVERLVDLALAGRLALSARVSLRAATYNQFRRRLSAEPAQQRINIDNEISDVATVVDVHSPDTVGLLFRLTQAFAELGLDIRSSKVQTLGPQAVDSFYLTRGDEKLDPDLLAELELAVNEVVADAAED